MVKFLIVRFSSIGDIVLTTPVIRCLKQQVEGAEVHFLTKKQFYPVIKSNPNIDKIYLLDNSFGALIKHLKQEEYHYIIDLHHNLRTLRLKQALRVLAFPFDKLNFKKWLLVNLKINKLPAVHIVDRYFHTVSLFDVVNDGKGLDYFIPEDEEVNLSSLPEAYRKGYIAVVVGAGHVTKQIPDDKLAEICNRIELPVVLLGGREDYQKAENVKKQCSKELFNGCGKYSINQSASLIRQAAVVITPDTGLMHIAAAFKKKIISVWGNTVPEFGMYPYHPHPSSAIFEVKGLKCRPCSKIGYAKCPKKHFRCMNEIDYESLVNAITSLLKIEA
ncbi:MAG: glycosyltransferase family 9 protein [Bacteroidales bacterium]|nr:glycosyltransferase family 9 protein [Bacteroidales bacterium]